MDYEKIVKKSPNGIIFADGEFKIVYFNDSAERLTGIAEKFALNRDFFNLFPQMIPYKDDLSEDRINRVDINGQSLCFRNFENNDENERFNHKHIFVIHDYYEALSLATELEKTEQVMTELQEIIEGSFDGIMVTDGNGNVLLVNQSYVRHTDIQKKELLGHNVKELINPVWMKNSVALLVIEQRQPVSMHHTTKHNKNIMVTGTPVFDRDNIIKKIVINTRDISEIYQLREELSRALEMEKIYFQQNEAIADCNDEGGLSIIAVDEKMKDIFSLAKKISSFNTTVLILGESGVGKEVVANYIHSEDPLKGNKPFIAVNCGAIPENLLESELFGYTEGAFTGALKGGKPGLLEAADGGTLFLDEICEMSLSLQVKLLRVLETRTVMRLGSSESIPLNMRVIAATNKNILDMVNARTFREDLYYRLNVVTIQIPPLKDRVPDIGPMALKFINHFNRQYGQNKKLTYEVVKELERFSWPGSIRQLKNVIENMVIISNNEYIQLNDLPWIDGQTPQKAREQTEGKTLQQSLDELEESILRTAKEEYGSSRKIAEVLRVDQSTVIRKMKKYQL